MKRMMKKVIATVLACSMLFGAFSLQVFAKGDGDFEVAISNNKVGARNTFSFEIPTENNMYLTNDKNIKITFPYQYSLPASIDEEDVLFNGIMPKAVKVSGKTITITTPKILEGFEDIKITLKVDAGIINPDKAGDFILRVSAQLKELYILNGKVKERIVTKSYKSDSFTTKGEEVTAPTEPTNPVNPNPVPPTDDQGIGKNEVIVRVGSTVGFYQKPKRNGDLTSKIGKLSAAPYISQGNTMIPFRFIAEGLDATIGYDEKTGIVGVYIDSKYMEFEAGSETAVIEGLPVGMPIAPEIKEGQIMLPLRFAVETMGAKLTWFADTQTILITK